MGYAPIISPTVTPPRLRVELVPATCWLSNVRSYLNSYQWKKLSGEVRSESGDRCEVCGGRGRHHSTECHEVWLYDDEQRMQTLLRLQALCPMCHSIKHLGRTLNEGNEDMAVYWLGKVNGWDHRQVAWYIGAVFAQWSARSAVEWALDLTVLGEVYEQPLERLHLERFVLSAAERSRMQHGREVRMEDVYGRDGKRAR